MPRILPDVNDQVVWLLNEQSGNYHNTGQFLPNNATTDLVITNSIVRSSAGLFGGNCTQIPGTSNFPSGSSATRNYASGANAFVPNPPLTISCWLNLKSYTTNNNMGIVSKEFYNPALNGNSWVAPFYAFTFNILTSNGGGDWTAGFAQSVSSGFGFNVTDFPIPLGQWSHVGFTHDGTNMRIFLNGCQMVVNGNPSANFLAAPPIIYTDGTHGFGPWKIGAITNTGSSSKEELNGQVQDIRIASVARSLNYFQKVYQAGILPLVSGTFISNQFYKLRAYDLGCSTPTPVVWIDTQVSLANAPAFPCSGPYSTPEVLDTWFQ